MAQEWYLMKSPHDTVSGFEGEAISDFAQEGFLEMLDSEIADDVELYNYDLSECKHLKAFIGSKTPDTKLKTLTRHMMVPIGTCKAGMYVKYKDRFWLIVGMVDDNLVYEKAILLICNYKLEWINADGKIIERWVNAESASQYNNGETNMVYFYVRSDQLMVYMPDDDEGLFLDSGQRFIIDKRCSAYEKNFDGEKKVVTGLPLTVYKITRNDTILDNYVDSGIIGFITTQTEQKETDGYYIVDGVGHWLCDVPNPDHNPSPASCAIDSDSDSVYIDLEPTMFTMAFYDPDGNPISPESIDYEVKTEADFGVDRLEIDRVGNILMVSTSDYSLNGKSFTITLSSPGYNPFSKTVIIREFI